MTTTHLDLDAELAHDGHRWHWTVYPADGSPIVLAAGSTRFRFFAGLALRRSMRRIRAAAQAEIAFLPTRRGGRA